MQDTGQPETNAAPGETGVVIIPEKTDISKISPYSPSTLVNFDVKKVRLKIE